MLRDARQWLNSGHISDVRHAKSGGTALHVAAAKGYTEVLKYVLLFTEFHFLKTCANVILKQTVEIFVLRGKQIVSKILFSNF